jgi:hypothetical protein
MEEKKKRGGSRKRELAMEEQHKSKERTNDSQELTHPQVYSIRSLVDHISSRRKSPQREIDLTQIMSFVARCTTPFTETGLHLEHSK